MNWLCEENKRLAEASLRNLEELMGDSSVKGSRERLKTTLGETI